MLDNLHLDIDAQVVRQLGEELITDSEQALLELVKNSYDADAEWCSVEIDTKHVEDLNDQNSIEKKENQKPIIGKITVKDNGCGMTLEDIRRGWLTISLSPKKAMKEKGLTTNGFKRTPLGDKGLGRLGTMKLGNRLKITTFYDSEADGYEVSFFWNDCQSGLPLSQVPVDYKKIPATGETNTSIEICGLANPSYWTGEKRLKALRIKMSTLISPFKSFENFDIGLDVNGRAIDLVRVPEKFLETASTHFEVIWDDELLELKGEVKLNLFKIGKQDSFFQHHVFADKGLAFFDYLKIQKLAKKYKLHKSDSRQWFIEFSDAFSWDDILEIDRGVSEFRKPGVFLGELYGFDLDLSKTEIPDIASGISEYKQLVRELAGIYVYRDNFRIRMGRDWLNLGDAWTSGRSWYGLKPGNTIGYIALSAKDNPKLTEKSDREGFVDSPELNGFIRLAIRLRKFANDSLNDFRRAYNDFRKIEKNKASDRPVSFSAEQGAEELSKLVISAKDIRNTISQQSKKHIVLYEQTQKEIKQVLADKKIGKKIKNHFLKIQKSVDDLIGQFKSNINNVETILKEITEKERSVELILERFEQFNEQMSEVYETVGVGLSAQGLVHEVHPFIDEIAARIQKVRNRLKDFSNVDAAIAGDLENIRAQAAVIGKKMAYIDPMLRTFRETRSRISLNLFLRDFFELRQDRLERFGIKYFVPMRAEGDLVLNVNKGRLTQVIDNLYRNSDYWLRGFGDKNPNAVLEIHAELESPYLIFWDTGPGVRAPMEEVVFEIFTSDKPKGEGHGLGLFIVTQLLEGEGCSIRLGEEKNDRGRRYKFIIDFSGVLDD